MLVPETSSPASHRTHVAANATNSASIAHRSRQCLMRARMPALCKSTDQARKPVPVPGSPKPPLDRAMGICRDRWNARFTSTLRAENGRCSIVEHGSKGRDEESNHAPSNCKCSRFEATTPGWQPLLSLAGVDAPWPFRTDPAGQGQPLCGGEGLSDAPHCGGKWNDHTATAASYE